MGKPWPVLLMVRELGMGGAERDLAKIALGLDRSVFAPHVGAFIPDGVRTPELRDSGVPILHLPVRSFGSLSAVIGARQMGAYTRRHGIQLVHSYDVPTTVFGVPVARAYGTPVVISSQLSYRDLVKRPLVIRPMLRLTDKLVDRVVVNCVAMRDHLVQDEKASPDKPYLCYNGVDVGVFFPGTADRPPELNGASLVVGAVCALRPEKRLDLILDAFAAVRHLRPGMKLAIVGGGEVLPALLAQARGLGIQEDCVFHPPTSDVAPWLRAIDVFILSSASEAFSNALLEAMACGCCPIGSRVGGTPELIGEAEERGALFTPGDAAELARKLADIITHEPKRRAYREAAACFARETLTVEIAVKRMSELYAGELQARARQPR